MYMHVCIQQPSAMLHCMNAEVRQAWSLAPGAHDIKQADTHLDTIVQCYVSASNSPGWPAVREPAEET